MTNEIPIIKGAKKVAKVETEEEQEEDFFSQTKNPEALFALGFIFVRILVRTTFLLPLPPPLYHPHLFSSLSLHHLLELLPPLLSRFFDR